MPLTPAAISRAVLSAAFVLVTVTTGASAEAATPPRGLTLQTPYVAEGVPAGTIVGRLVVDDIDAGDTHTFELLDGAGGLFALNGDRVVTAAPLDHESTPIGAVRVRVVDSAGLEAFFTVVVTIADVNEAPTGITLSKLTIRENRAAGALVAWADVIDPDLDDTHTLFLVDDGEGYFEFDALMGNTLVTTGPIDGERFPTLPIVIRAVDAGGRYIDLPFTITILDSEEEARGILLSSSVIRENAPAGAVVGNFVAWGFPDLSDIQVFSLVENPDDMFVISGGSLINVKPFAHETRFNYPIVVRATDRNGTTVEVPFVITVLDVEEPPLGVDISGRTVAENAPAGTLVGTLAQYGDLDTPERHFFTLITNPDDRFDIIGDRLIARLPFDYEVDPTVWRLEVKVTDRAGLSATTVIFVDVTDVAEAPSALALGNDSVGENMPVGTLVGEVLGAIDPDSGDEVVLTIVHDLASAFVIDRHRMLRTTKVLDHETRPTASITVRATDRTGLFVETTFVIEIDDVNEAPLAVVIDTDHIAEGARPPAIVGQLTIVGDPDVGDVHVITIAEDPDAMFAVDGDALVLVVAANHELSPTHDVWLTATDSGGLTVTTRLTITIDDRNDAPAATALDFELPAIAEDASSPAPMTYAGLVLLTGVSDEDGDAVAFAVVSADTFAGQWERAEVAEGPWAALEVGAEIAAGDAIRFIPRRDFYGTISPALVLAATDGVATGAAIAASLEVTPVNDAPTVLVPTFEGGALTIWENQSAFARVVTPPVDPEVDAPVVASIVVGDVDAEDLAVTLTFVEGTLTLPTVGLELEDGAVGTSRVVVFGPIADLNTALADLRLSPKEGFVGAAKLVVQTSDRGATGAGGTRVTTTQIPVDVSAAAELVVLYDGSPIDLARPLALGNLGTGALVHLSFELKNGGSSALEVGTGAAGPGVGISETTGADAWISVWPPSLVPPGESAPFVVTLRPSAVGAVGATLSIASNVPTAEDGDGEPTPMTLTLSGRAREVSDVMVWQGIRPVYSDLEHKVQAVSMDVANPYVFSVANIGLDRLEVGTPIVVSSSNGLVEIEAPFPLIDVGEEEELVVWLKPTRLAPAEAEIHLPTNDPDMPVFVLRIAARASSSAVASLVVERFPGVELSDTSVNDVGYFRVNEEAAVPLRLVNLGLDTVSLANLSVGGLERGTVRLGGTFPEALAPGQSADLEVLLRPEADGALETTLKLGDTSWELAGTGLAVGAGVPVDSERRYRFGRGEVFAADNLGPVYPATEFRAAWILSQEGPVASVGPTGYAITDARNVTARPEDQPVAPIAARGFVMVPVSYTPKAVGPLSFGLRWRTVEDQLLGVESAGQVGALWVETKDGARVDSDEVITLPLMTVGTTQVISFDLINAGSGPLRLVSPPSVGRTAVCLRVEGPAVQVIAAGARATMKLVMTPVAGAFDCQLAVTTDDPETPEFRFAVVSRGANAGKKSGCTSGDSPEGAALMLLALALLAFRMKRSRA